MDGEQEGDAEAVDEDAPEAAASVTGGSRSLGANPLRWRPGRATTPLRLAPTTESAAGDDGAGASQVTMVAQRRVADRRAGDRRAASGTEEDSLQLKGLRPADGQPAGEQPAERKSASFVSPRQRAQRFNKH